MEYGMHGDRQPGNDRASAVNGIREERGLVKREGSPGSRGGRDAPSIAGDHGRRTSQLDVLPDAKLNELPDEIQHITAEIMPLGLLLSRLAQFSHGKLQELIISLAEKPLPEHTPNGGANGTVAGGVNGNVKGMINGPGPALEDTSPESLEKKTMVLNLVKDLHSRWVKALVITEWSRNAEEVGKLIDLRQHLANELDRYTKVFWDMIKVKDEMAFAKVPSPDLKTALEVLNSGAVHWMPDFGYLPDPPLTAEQKLHWLNEIDVTLHMRLQLHEFEHLPHPWKEYEIDSGRVTFAVPGEFEVDLTIFDEDFETSQFWFLDFRQTFQPAPPDLSESARTFVEAQVNTILRDEGLPGCYNFLHELTLTTKIGEFERQANLLSQSGLWIGTLKVERLNRCLSIQYWAQSAGPPHWILLGVHSGTTSEGFQDPGAPSHLMVQWFRDGKRVDDVDIPVDVDTISVERLLMTVISKHTAYLLSSIYKRLSAKPRYSQQEGRLALQISVENPLSSSLAMQLLGEEDAVLRVSPWTGNFNFLRPPSVLVREWKQRFNSLRNRAEDGAAALERFRCFYVSERLKIRAEEAGWEFLPASPVPLDDVKNLIYKRAPSSREGVQGAWMRNSSWDPHWYAMLSMSLGGDHWWLVEVLTRAPEAREAHSHGKYINTFTPINPPTDMLHLPRSFFDHLAEYGANTMAQIKALRTLSQGRVSNGAQGSTDRVPGTSALPDKPRTRLRLSHLLGPGTTSNDFPGRSWAQEFIDLDWKGLAPIPTSNYKELVASAGSPQQQQQPPWLRVMVEAKITATNRAKFALLENMLDRDVFYDHRLGQFTLRFQPEINSGFIPLLRSRILSLNRLVDFVDALRRGGKHVVPERVTLPEIIFSYGSSSAPPADQQSPADQEKNRPWKVRFELAKEGDVNMVLESGNPHLRVIDLLRAAANSPTFKKLPAWLIFTLPLYRALERVQDSWDIALAKAQGACYIFHKTLDWVTIRFALSGAANRRVHLDIKPNDRNGRLLWHVFRSASDANANNENDEFNKVLKQRVWSASGKEFKGLSNSAAASWDSGIEVLLALISDSILSLVGTPPPQQLQQNQPPAQRLQPPAQEPQQQPAPPQASQARFHHPLQQPQQTYPHHMQQPRMPPQHMAQANMLGQGQHQGQAQNQQRAGLGKNHAPVVVLE